MSRSFLGVRVYNYKEKHDLIVALCSFVVAVRRGTCCDEIMFLVDVTCCNHFSQSDLSNPTFLSHPNVQQLGYEKSGLALGHIQECAHTHLCASTALAIIMQHDSCDNAACTRLVNALAMHRPVEARCKTIKVLNMTIITHRLSLPLSRLLWAS